MGCGPSTARTNPEETSDKGSQPAPATVNSATPIPGQHIVPTTMPQTVTEEDYASIEQHQYCGLPDVNKRGAQGYLGSDPHQQGWLAGKWSASSDDRERVDALRKLGILLTEREEAFDRLTKLGSQLMETSICLISFVDEEEQWFKSAVGLADEKTSRDAAFCTYTVLREMPGCFIVLDAPADPRFANNPLVTGPPYIRFYAGAPIKHPDSNFKIGSFCVIDSKPREQFSAASQRTLQMLADMVQHELVSRATRIAHENKTRVLMALSSEMRETQRTLESSINNYRNLIENANAPIWAADSSPENRITLWNQKIASLTGITAQRALTKPLAGVFKFAAGAHKEAFMRALATSLSEAASLGQQGEGGAPVGVQTQVVDANFLLQDHDPDATPINVVMSPIVNDQRAITGVVCIGEVKATARQARPQTPPPAGGVASEGLPMALPSEMRPPLEGVVSALDRALRDAELRKSKVGRLVRQAWTSANVMKGLAADELDASRIAPGAVKLQSEVFTAHEVCEVSISIALPNAERKGLRITTQMDPSMRQVFVHGDPHRICRCLSAVLTNATQYTQRGEVALKVWLAKANGAAQTNGPFTPAAGDTVTLNFEVRDTGKGMHPDVAKSVNNGTMQGSSGLAVCLALVHTMGGHTQVSTSSEGTKVTFSAAVSIATPAAAAAEQRATGPFALTDSSDLIDTESNKVPSSGGKAGITAGIITNQVSVGGEAPKPEAVAAPSRGRANVFAADDSEYNMDVARNMLDMLGHDVVSANNGKIAVDRIFKLRSEAAKDPSGQSDVHIIFMDCDMPIMDGWEATVEIRKMEEEQGWSRVPIIAFTAYASSDTRAKCFDSGMDDYLTKPYSLATLRTKLAVHLKDAKLKPNTNDTKAGAPPDAPKAAAVTPATTAPAVVPEPKAPPASVEARVPAAPQMDVDVEDSANEVYKALASKQVVNASQMQAIFGGNKALMTQAVTMFVNTSREVPGQIETAMAKKDFEKLHRTVHQCKGSAGYIGAERVQAVALDLQQAARDLQTQQAAAADPLSVNAPPKVKAQVYVLSRCLTELFTELDKMQLAQAPS